MTGRATKRKCSGGAWVGGRGGEGGEGGRGGGGGGGGDTGMHRGDKETKGGGSRAEKQFTVNCFVQK